MLLREGAAKPVAKGRGNEFRLWLAATDARSLGFRPVKMRPVVGRAMSAAIRIQTWRLLSAVNEPRTEPHWNSSARTAMSVTQSLLAKTAPSQGDGVDSLTNIIHGPK